MTRRRCSCRRRRRRVRRGGRGDHDLGGAAVQKELEGPAVACEVGRPRCCAARLTCGTSLANRGIGDAGPAIWHLEDAMRCGARGSSRRRCPGEGENRNRVVGASDDGPGRRRRIELHKLVRARCGGDEIRECGKKRIADVDSHAVACTREGGEDEADAARLRCGLGIDAHLQDVYDACILGLELGHGAVAAILLRVVYIAHGIVAEDGVKSGVCEAERR